MAATVWYLYHSGFAVDSQEHFFIFDYWRNTPKGAGLESGVIQPEALANRNVIVFASHRHGDHFNREILSWQDAIPRLRLVLSDDIKTAPGALMVGPGQVLEQGDFTLRTYLSNDEGVAFLLEADGLRIYHAGDLNWWHWAGESEAYNSDMAARYKKEIAALVKDAESIDLAFVPVDPRLGDQYRWGLDYLMAHVEVRRVVPMHFGDDSAVVDRLLADPHTRPYQDRILPLKRRGQQASI